MAYTTIKKPSDYFNTKLYTGTGSSNAITGVGFQPDFTWIKQRSNAENHALFDAVRGVTKYVKSDETASEVTEASSLSAFGTDGFTVVSSGKTNTSGRTYASWNWLANGAGAANTDGSISSTVSANTTSGFSIVQYTGNASAGATIGHGLGSVPKMVIVKKTNAAKDWNVYHVGMGATKGMYLNLTNAEQTHTNWNNTTPTSSVFSIGSDDQVNGSGQTYIAYCFADVQGYSKFGSYVGNGNADGTFVYTGFKPAFVMTKEWEGTSDWYINDTTRDFNGTYGNDASLLANTSGAEFTSSSLNVDMLSNGFKLRSANPSTNEVAGYIYMAFAEQPLVGDNPATAR